MELEFVSESLDFINPLMRLSARETFMGFCRREKFKAYSTNAILFAYVVLKLYIDYACRSFAQLTDLTVRKI